MDFLENMPLRYGRRSRPRRNYRKTRRNTKKKALSRKYSSKRFRSSIPRGIAARPFPQIRSVVLSYTSEPKFLQQSTASIPVNYVVRGNGMYDPDQSGAGHKPRYYDTFLGADGTDAPYQRYTVMASKIIVKIWPTQSSPSSANCILSVTPTRGSVTAPGGFAEMYERSFARQIEMASSNAVKPRTLISFAKTKTIMAVKDVRDDENLSATYNNTPSNSWFWNISLCNVQSAILGECYISFTVKYYAILETINDVADS